jgi:hypothetical protein
MIPVAVPAGGAGVVFHQVPVQSGGVLQLGGNIRMAGHAFVGHVGGCLPESRMAGGTMAAEGGMRAYPTQWRTCLCIKRTRVEKYASE